MFTDTKPPRTENKRGETMLTLDAFEEAAAKVKEVTQETKLIESPYFSEISRNRVFFKPENMQRTGAYKVRGAYYKISTLTDEERAHGLITASAGNHAQGVAYAAQHYGVKATIVMPTTTPLIKVERTKALGADVVLAWPSAVISPLAPETAVQILWRDRLAAMQDPTADREALAAEYAAEEGSPLKAAAGGYLTDVVAPEETKAKIAMLLEMLAGKRVSRLPKKHSNIQL